MVTPANIRVFRSLAQTCGTATVRSYTFRYMVSHRFYITVPDVYLGFQGSKAIKDRNTTAYLHRRKFILQNSPPKMASNTLTLNIQPPIEHSHVRAYTAYPGTQYILPSDEQEKLRSVETYIFIFAKFPINYPDLNCNIALLRPRTAAKYLSHL